MLKILPITKSTSGVTTTNRQGNAADVMIIRTQSVRTRYLTTVLKFSLSKRDSLAQVITAGAGVIRAVGCGIAVGHTMVCQVRVKRGELF